MFVKYFLNMRGGKCKRGGRNGRKSNTGKANKKEIIGNLSI